MQNFPKFGILLVILLEFLEGGELKVWYKWNVSLVKKTTEVGCLLGEKVEVVGASVLLVTLQLFQNLLQNIL